MANNLWTALIRTFKPSYRHKKTEVATLVSTRGVECVYFGKLLDRPGYYYFDVTTGDNGEFHIVEMGVAKAFAENILAAINLEEKMN